MTGPLVSVVIPTYNYARYIPEAIESVLAQSYTNIEIIVIDDGSTDDTAAVVAKFGDRIQYHFQSNRGLSASRNKGIELSSGTYIQFLDSDDKLGKRSIEVKVKYLETHSETAFACSPNRFFFENKNLWYNLAQNFLRGWRLPNQRDIVPTLCYGNIAPPHAFLTRLGAISAQCLRFDESMKACEDYDFWLRLMTTCGPPAVVREGTVFYRKHASSMSADQQHQLRYDAIMVERAFASIASQQLPAAESACKIEQLIANFTAAIKCYYRLMAIGEQKKEIVLFEHIDKLAARIAENYNGKQIRSTRYLLELRISFAKLSMEGFPLPITARKLVQQLTSPWRASSLRYLFENIAEGNATPELTSVVILDLQHRYLWLKRTASFSHQRDGN